MGLTPRHVQILRLDLNNPTAALVTEGVLNGTTATWGGLFINSTNDMHVVSSTGQIFFVPRIGGVVPQDITVGWRTRCL